MFGICFQLLITQKFYFLWDPWIDLVQFLLLIIYLFLLQPPIPKLIDPRPELLILFFIFFFLQPPIPKLTKPKLS